MMMVSPAPALKPTRMLSLTRRTRMLSLNSHAIRHSTATAQAARLAICAYRTASPPASAPTRAGNHQRDRRGRADRKLARRAEQRIADAAKHIAVDADLRRQAGQRRIGERHRDRISRERHAGDDIMAQPGGAIFGKPRAGGKNFIPVHFTALSCSAPLRLHRPDAFSAKEQDDQQRGRRKDQGELGYPLRNEGAGSRPVPKAAQTPMQDARFSQQTRPADPARPGKCPFDRLTKVTCYHHRAVDRRLRPW